MSELVSIGSTVDKLSAVLEGFRAGAHRKEAAEAEALEKPPTSLLERLEESAEVDPSQRRRVVVARQPFALLCAVASHFCHRYLSAPVRAKKRSYPHPSYSACSTALQLLAVGTFAPHAPPVPQQRRQGLEPLVVPP